MDAYEVAVIDMSNEQLAVANKFDRSALTLNRQGILAASQMKLIRSRIWWFSFFLLVWIGVGIYQYLKSGLPASGYRGNVLIAIYLLAFILLGRTLFFALRNIVQKKVESMEGVGFKTYTIDSDNNSETYYYKIGDTRFQVNSRAAYDALISELMYRAYYLPNSKVLVNIEALETHLSK